MPAPPARAEISAPFPNPSNAVAREGFAKFWDYVTGLLGLSGNAADARTALGVPATTAVVSKAGDTMTGDLTINKAAPALALNKSSFAQLVSVQGRSGGTLQWSMALGDSAGDFWLNQYDGSGAFNRQAIRYSSAGAMTINGARIDLSAPDVRVIGITTTASGANLYQDPSGGNLYRSTSSLRYKTDVEDMTEEAAERILEGTRAIWYRSTSEADRPDWSWYGFPAEGAAAADPRLVHWIYPDSAYRVRKVVEEHPVSHQVVVGQDEHGVDILEETIEMQTIEREERELIEGAEQIPDGVMYERFVVPLLVSNRKQKRQISDLLERLERLEAAR